MIKKIECALEYAEFYLLKHNGKFASWEDWKEFKSLILDIVRGKA